MRLHFQTYGRGEPLIILHGLLGSLDNWHSVSLKLAERFQVWAVDQRNHGRSPHDAEMSYPILAEDIREFMQVQGLARACLLGHSMGGKTAMQLALLYPERVAKLIVADISPRASSPRHDRTLEGLSALDLAAFANRREMEAALAPWVPDLTTRRFLLKNVARADEGFHWRIGLREIHRNYGRLGAALAGERQFAGPALFLRGEWSDHLQESDLPLILACFPQAHLRTSPHSGHLLHTENPAAFLAAVQEFLCPAGN